MSFFEDLCGHVKEGGEYIGSVTEEDGTNLDVYLYRPTHSKLHVCLRCGNDQYQYRPIGKISRLFQTYNPEHPACALLEKALDKFSVLPSEETRGR